MIVFGSRLHLHIFWHSCVKGKKKKSFSTAFIQVDFFPPQNNAHFIDTDVIVDHFSLYDVTGQFHLLLPINKLSKTFG